MAVPIPDNPISNYNGSPVTPGGQVQRRPLPPQGYRPWQGYSGKQSQTQGQRPSRPTTGGIRPERPQQFQQPATPPPADRSTSPANMAEPVEVGANPYSTGDGGILPSASVHHPPPPAPVYPPGPNPPHPPPPPPPTGGIDPVNTPGPPVSPPSTPVKFPPIGPNPWDLPPNYQGEEYYGGGGFSNERLPDNSPWAMPDDATYRPGQLPNDPLGTYRGYQFTRDGFATYNPGQVDQYSRVGDQGLQDLQRDTLMNVLRNPGMGDLAVAQMKERQKEGVLDQEKQRRMQMQQSAAARGTGGSGQLAGAERRMGDLASGQILQGQRDIDIEAANRRQSDQLAGIGAAESVLSGQTGRNISQYEAALRGQMSQEQLKQLGVQSQQDASRFGFDVDQAQAGENFRAFDTTRDATQYALDRALKQEALNQAGADSVFSRFQQGQDNRFQAEDQRRQRDDFELQRRLGTGQQALDREMGYGNLRNEWRGMDIQQLLGQGGLDIDRYRVDVQKQLGEGGLGVDNRRISSQDRQFDLSHALALKQFLESQRQFNRRLGFDYSGLEVDANRNTYGSLF